MKSWFRSTIITLCCLVSTFATAVSLEPKLILLLSGGKPVASQNFLSNTTTPVWFDISGIVGNRTMYDSTGLLTWAPNNQYTNSNAATNTARTITTVAGINYYIWIQTSSGSATIVASGTNSSTFSGSAAGTFTAFTATSGTLTLTPTTNYTNITQVVVAQVTYENALRPGDNVITGASGYFGLRFDTDPNTLFPRGILREESRTNSLTYSEKFNLSPWATSAATISPDVTTAPDGTTNADLLYPTSTGASREVYQPAGYSVGNTYSLSIQAKPAGMTWMTFGAGAGSGAAARLAFFNLSSCTVGTTGASITATAIKLRNSYCRLTVTYTPAGSGGYMEISPVDGDNNYTATANGTNGIYLWGAEIEIGAFTTSYIPTYASSASRPADIIKLSGVALSTIGASAGTVIQEDNLEGNIAANQYAIYGNSVSPIYFDNALAIKATNGTNVLTSGSSAVIATPIRTGLSWDASGRAISVNGATPVVDGNSFGTVGATVYDGSNNGSNTANGWLRTFSIYNTKLLGSAFTTKTTTGGPL